MKYKKVQIIAKNNPTGSFAAGCPVHSHGKLPGGACYHCEIKS